MFLAYLIKSPGAASNHGQSLPAIFQIDPTVQPLDQDWIWRWVNLVWHLEGWGHWVGRRSIEAEVDHSEGLKSPLELLLWLPLTSLGYSLVWVNDKRFVRDGKKNEKRRETKINSDRGINKNRQPIKSLHFSRHTPPTAYTQVRSNTIIKQHQTPHDHSKPKHTFISTKPWERVRHKSALSQQFFESSIAIGSLDIAVSTNMLLSYEYIRHSSLTSLLLEVILNGSTIIYETKTTNMSTACL